MTREEKRILEAAQCYVDTPGEGNLARLVTAVMDLPLTQWPAGTCAPVAVTAANNKRKIPLAPLIVHRGPKPEEGDAAYPDKIVDLDTGEKKELP